ncbi:MAG: hypothetical protein CVU48_02240 [Candidatus Cloacimonetes bacterium HGW-Cloacimonetes-1]|jgi:hypothetical protein|nr:MAG: hypothetical protein CVU48_02240 [Candidatus Cloacimonetes bacterium HGW-Cloacimonetes-1]
MKRHLVAIFILITAIISLSAESFVIGAGTGTTSVLPVFGSFEYGWSWSLYTVAEMNAVGMNTAMDIISISYDVATNPVNFTMNNQSIYMRLSSATAVAMSYPGTAGFTNVLNANTTWNGSGWKTLTLDTPFSWNGTQNIEILWENRDGSYANGAPGFHYTSTNPEMMSSYKVASSSFPTGNGNFSYERPNITFSSAAGTIPSPAVNTFPQDLQDWVEEFPTLSWSSGGGAPTGYKLYFGSVSNPPLIADLGDVTSWTPPTALEYLQQYNWKIVPYNSEGEAEDCQEWSFVTVDNDLVPIGTDLTTQRQPFGADYGFERSAMLFFDSEIVHTAASLQKVAVYNSYSTDAEIPYKIYAKETTAVEFSATPWEDFIMDAILLKVGVQTFDTPGWNVFDLDNPFSYTGNNLIIIVETDYGLYGDDSFPQFRYSTETEDVHQYWYSHYTPPTDNGRLNGRRPNVLLQFEPPVTGPPQPVILEHPWNGQTGMPLDGFNLRWSPNGTGGMPDSYAVYMSQSAADISDFYHPGISSTLFDPISEGGLSFNYGEIWYWTVEATNSDGSAITMPVWSFQIEEDPRRELPLTESFDAYAWPDGWIQYYTGLFSNRWIVSATSNAGAAPYEMRAIPIGQVGTSRLVSPPLNTDGVSTLYMVFNHSFLENGSGVSAQIQHSYDGVTWYTPSWSHASADGDASGAVSVTINGLNSPVTYISWTLDGMHDRYENWFIDDVRIVDVLTAPVAQLASNGRLSWTPVPGATGYRILACDDPNGDFVAIDATVNTYWQESDMSALQKFYKVVALIE